MPKLETVPGFYEPKSSLDVHTLLLNEASDLKRELEAFVAGSQEKLKKLVDDNIAAIEKHDELRTPIYTPNATGDELTPFQIALNELKELKTKTILTQDVRNIMKKCIKRYLKNTYQDDLSLAEKKRLNPIISKAHDIGYHFQSSCA